jgi:hypothetical protein
MAFVATAVIAGAGLAPTVTSAGWYGNRADVRADRQDLRADRQDIRRDRADLRRDFGDLRRDLRSRNRADFARDLADIRRDRMDLRNDQRDIRRDRRDLFFDRRGYLIRDGGPDHFAPDVHSVIPGAPRRSEGEPGIQQLDSGFSMIGLRLMISPRK